jgi:hypothetical protein
MGHQRSPLYVEDVNTAIHKVLIKLQLAALTAEAIEMVARELIHDRALTQKYNKASREHYARRTA